VIYTQQALGEVRRKSGISLKSICERNGWHTTEALTLAKDASLATLGEVERRYLDAAKACVGKGHNIEASYVRELTGNVMRILRQEVRG